MTRKIIAIVEDNPQLLENYSHAFESYGYDILGFSSREQAEKSFLNKLPDLVMIDINLNDEPEGGFDLCQFLREKSKTLPIIFLTSLDQEHDVISGLRMGADDYISKSVSLKLLHVRIASLFKRLEARLDKKSYGSNFLELGRVKIDIPKMEIFWNDVLIPLTVTEFLITYALVKNNGKVLSKSQLIEHSEIFIDESSVVTQIKQIRKKFLFSDDKFDAIKTKYGAGYQWHSEH